MLTEFEPSRILLLSAVVCLSGCSGLGRFSRQDYASLVADPFLESDSGIDTNDALPGGGSSTSGFARLDAPPLQPGTGVSFATIPDTRSSGPSLSDFLEPRSEDSPAGLQEGSGIITAAADSLTTSRAQAADIAGTAQDEFLDWATGQERAIRQVSGQVNDQVGNTVRTADHQIRNEATQVQSAISQFPTSATGRIQATTGEFFEDETAEPLIQNRVPQASAVVSDFAEENPFAEIERQHRQSRKDSHVYPTATMKTAAAPANAGRLRPAPRGTTASTSTQETASAKQFAKDSGWRPANLEFP